MAAKNSIPPLNTLKECLMFLEWFKNERSMRDQVVSGLLVRYDKYYNFPRFRSQLPDSLNNFLRSASELYKQICISASPGNFGSNTADVLTEAFSKCLSKVHSAFSLLLFHVDYTYGNVGGGRWMDLETNAGGNALQTYLTTEIDDLYNGVIPGGFDEHELNGVTGRQFAGHLQDALKRKTITPDLFTSVLFNNLEKDDWHKQDAGNVLLLLWAFCEYVERHQKGDGDLKTNLETELRRKGMCFDWDKLVKHCTKLKTELSKLFGGDKESSPKPFTTTGRAFTPDALRPEAFAGAFEKWFEKHWGDIGNTLDAIKMGVDALDEPSDFSPESLYPYGIVLNGDQQSKWEEGLKNLPGVLQALGNSDKGYLKTLKDILGGQVCPVKPPPPPPAKPAAKPVVTKAEPAKPTANKSLNTENGSAQNQGKKAEGAQNQGKKSEGAQNQGKKAEGAQNQGKKAEGTTNNGQSNTITPSSQVAQAVQTRNPIAPSSESQSPGAPSPGSGQDTGGQAASSGPGQQSGQEAEAGKDAGTTSPTAPGPGVGGDRAGGDSGGKGNGDPPPHQCKDDNFEHFTMGDSKYCVRKATLKLNPEDQKRQDDVWQAQKRHIVEQIYDKHNSDHPNRLILRNRINTAESRISHTIPSHPSRPVPGPSHQSTGFRPGHVRPYFIPRERYTVQGGESADGNAVTDTPFGYIDGTVIQHNTDIELQKLKDRFEAFHNVFQTSRDLQERQDNDEQKQLQETIKQKEMEAATNLEQQRQEAERRLKQYYDDVERIQNTLERGRKDAEARRKQDVLKRKSIVSPPYVDGFRPTENPQWQSWPWWYHDLPDSPIVGTPVADEYAEARETDRIRSFQQYDKDTIDAQTLNNTAMADMQAREKEKIEQNNTEAEEKFRKEYQNLRLQMQLPPISTVLYKHPPRPSYPHAAKSKSETDPLFITNPGISGQAIDGASPVELIVGAQNYLGGDAVVPPPPSPLPDFPYPKQDDPNPQLPNPLDPFKFPNTSEANAYAEKIMSAVEIRKRDFTHRPDGVTNRESIPLVEVPPALPSLTTLDEVKPTGPIEINTELNDKLGNMDYGNFTKSSDLLAQNLGDLGQVKDAKHDVIDLSIPELPDIEFIKQTREASAPDIHIEVAKKWPSNSKITPTVLSVDFQKNDPYHVLGMSPIHHEIQIEHKDFKTSSDDADLNLEDDADEKSFTDSSIYVPGRALQDSSYVLDIDEPPPPPELQPLDPIGPATPAINLTFPPVVDPKPKPPDDFDKKTIKQPDIELCLAPWATQTPTPGSTNIPETELFPAEAPRTVRDMLTWVAGLRNEKHHETLKQCIKKVFGGSHKDTSQHAIFINHAKIRPNDVFDILQLTAMFAGSVLTAIAPNWKANVSSKIVKPNSSTQSDELDCCVLLCQLRDYAYACHHQLQFLKAQCSRNELHGGWKSYEYGSDDKVRSPLHAFLTDSWDSDFETHLFDPCNLCLKSRIRMGFKRGDLPNDSQTGSTISTILSPTCGGSDPLLTLASYLNCLTRRTPRTTGELVSYFHHFGNELHYYASESLSPLGESLSSPHADCPDWDHLDGSDLDTVRGIRGSESLNVISKHNSSHDKEHPRTLSTLVGCGSDPDSCHPRMSPITYRAYALYSQSFPHTYLSWTVYLPDRLWESLEKLHYDLQKHESSKCSSLYLCSTALPLLYTHGITPPEGQSQPKLTCSDVIAKLQEIVNGKPIATLMTAMDDFLYRIREPFIFTLVALWSLAFLIFANTMLYRIDILHIRSHLIRTKASHLIDVKALLSDNKKMMSLYDANYFDDDPNELLNLK